MDRKFANKRFLNHRALIRVQQIRKQLSKFTGRWKIEETSCGDNVFPILKVRANGHFQKTEGGQINCDCNVKTSLNLVA